MICSACKLIRGNKLLTITPCEKHWTGWTIMVGNISDEVEVFPEEGWQ